MATSYCPAMTPAAAKCSACWLDPQARSTVVPGIDSGQPAHVARLVADLVHAAPDDVVDQGRVDSGAFSDGRQKMGGEIDGVGLGQRPPTTSDGGSYGFDDDSVTHGGSLGHGGA
jgi:hypothetical protein